MSSMRFWDLCEHKEITLLPVWVSGVSSWDCTAPCTWDIGAEMTEKGELPAHSLWHSLFQGWYKFKNLYLEVTQTLHHWFLLHRNGSLKGSWSLSLSAEGQQYSHCYFKTNHPRTRWSSRSSFRTANILAWSCKVALLSMWMHKLSGQSSLR